MRVCHRLRLGRQTCQYKFGTENFFYFIILNFWSSRSFLPEISHIFPVNASVTDELCNTIELSDIRISASIFQSKNIDFPIFPRNLHLFDVFFSREIANAPCKALSYDTHNNMTYSMHTLYSRFR